MVVVCLVSESKNSRRDTGLKAALGGGMGGLKLTLQRF